MSKLRLSDLKKEAETSPILQPALKALRDRPYRLPKTHASWDLLSAIGAILKNTDWKKAPDGASAIHCLLWQWWIDYDLPLYCISNELLRDFQQTEVDGLAKLIDESWERPIPGFLLSLPNSALCSPENRQPIPYLLVWIRDGDHDTDPGLRTQHDRQVCVATTDNEQTVWVTGFGLGNGKILFSPQSLGANTPTAQDEIFLAGVRAIALQCILALSYLPDLIEAPSAATSQPHQRAASTSARLATQKEGRSPRWIGRTYQRQSQKRSASTSAGHHTSRHAHWRRGHWRLQPVGQGRGDRRLQWIRPTWVDGPGPVNR